MAQRLRERLCMYIADMLWCNYNIMLFMNMHGHLNPNKFLKTEANIYTGQNNERLSHGDGGMFVKVNTIITGDVTF